MNSPDCIRLQHMLDSARDAMAISAGRDRGDLDRDRGLVLALVKCVEIIGEAANNITPETRDRLPEIPWIAIIAMRHRLVHGYFQINLDTVWKTLEEDLPPLIFALERIVSGETK